MKRKTLVFFFWGSLAFLVLIFFFGGGGLEGQSGFEVWFAVQKFPGSFPEVPRKLPRLRRKFLDLSTPSLGSPTPHEVPLNGRARKQPILSGSLRLRVQSRSRTQLRIADSIVIGVHSLSVEHETSTGVLANFSRE